MEAGVQVVVSRGKTLHSELPLYYAAKLTGQIAQNLLLAALFLMAGTSSHAAIGLSSLFLATLVPAVLFGFLGGAVVDRFGASRGFVIGPILRLWAVVLGLVFLGGPGSAWVVAFAYATVSQIASPAEMAMVRTLRGSAPARAHSMIVLLQYVGQGVGMLALAPALYYLDGPRAIIAGSAVIFALQIVLSGVVALRVGDEPAAAPHPGRSAFSFFETVRFFRREPLAREAVTVLAVKAMVAQGIVVALPLYLKHDMGLGTSALFFLLVPGIAGTIAGLIWAGGPRITSARCRETMRLSLAGMVVSVFALSALDLSIRIVAEYSHVPPIAALAVTMNTTFVVAIPVAFLLGMALAAALVSARVVLTERAPIGQQARVFAVQASLTDGLVVLPLLLLGVGAQFAGARPTLAAIGVVSTIAMLAITHPRFSPHVPALHLPGHPDLAPVPIEIASD